MVDKVRMSDKLILRISKLKLQASSLAALEIVLEDIVLKVTSMMESLSIQIADVDIMNIRIYLRREFRSLR